MRDYMQKPQDGTDNCCCGEEATHGADPLGQQRDIYVASFKVKLRTCNLIYGGATVSLW
jgi:hypothetical protein